MEKPHTSTSFTDFCFNKYQVNATRVDEIKTNRHVTVNKTVTICRQSKSSASLSLAAGTEFYHNIFKFLRQ